MTTETTTTDPDDYRDLAMTALPLTDIHGPIAGTLADYGAAPSPAPAAPSAARGWLPIETAPKDGTDILLYAPAGEWEGRPTDARTTVGHWTTEEECRRQIGDCGGECRCPEYDHDDPYWLSWDGGFLPELPPTHWQPLPAAPGAQPAQPDVGPNIAVQDVAEQVERRVNERGGEATVDEIAALTIEVLWEMQRAALRSGEGR